MVRNSDEERLVQAVVRINANILGLVLGVLLALIIFVATNWLLVKGGDQVGAHLQLLGQYYLGYSVSFVGSIIGMGYGFVTGYLIGRFTAVVYNAVLRLRDREGG